MYIWELNYTTMISIIGCIIGNIITIAALVALVYYYYKKNDGKVINEVKNTVEEIKNGIADISKAIESINSTKTEGNDAG